MSTQDLKSRRVISPSSNKPSTGWLIVGLIAAAAIIGSIAAASPGLQGARQIAAQLLALDSVQRMWFVTRAAGLTGYVLLWLSTAWGLVVSSKILDPLLHRSFSYDFHEFLSLLAIGFVGLHVIVLLADQYLPFTLLQVLIPFVAPYRPIWVGIGVIAFYLTILASVTFYMRARIGSRAFRLIHYSSFVAFLGAAFHGLLAGTDSSLLVTQILYAGTLLSVVFLTTYWLALQLQTRIQPKRSLPPRRTY
jgi:sulfoxide reductase heme-binding subunit YedZ